MECPVNVRSDEELLADHIAGNADAFDQIVRRYADELYGFLYRFAGNAALADDLVQETFVQVHTAAASFDAARNFKPWLYTIAANKARDQLRSRGRRGMFSLDTQAGDDGPTGAELVTAEDESQDEVVARKERRAQVREVIADMPEHLRLILTLGYFQQLPYADIAEILGIPVGTVKSRLHSAVSTFASRWHARCTDEVPASHE